jgi:hypothetical protein
MPKTYSTPRRLAVVALARLAGVSEAAKAARVDLGTVRDWLASADGSNPSVADWQASRDYAKEQELRAALAGNANLAYAWSKSAGVGQRNLNYERQVAAARRSEEEAPPEQPNPIRDAIDRLDDRRKRLLRDFIIAETRERAYRPPSDDRVGLGPPLDVVAFIDGLGALSDSEFEAEAAAVKAKLAEIDERYRAELSPASPQSSAVAEVAPEPADEPVSLSQARVARPRPVPQVIDFGGFDGSGDGPWYSLDDGTRRPPRW